jgi:hypothetical protein
VTGKRKTPGKPAVAAKSRVRPPKAPAVEPILEQEAPVDIHKPKPVHSLRELLSEVGVIVIGILIALGLEQAVEAMHWRHQAEGAERALGRELSETYGQASERVLVSDCVDQRLDQLAAVVDTAERNGRLPALGDIAMPPARTWSTGVWQSTLSGQTAEHMSEESRNAYSVIYGFSTMLSGANAREMDAWTRLYAMVGPGRTLTPVEAVSLRNGISEARMLNQVMGLASMRIQQMALGYRVVIDNRFVRTFDQPKSTYAICQPPGAVPAHYGAAPIAHAIERARENPIGKGHAGKAVAGSAGR